MRHWNVFDYSVVAFAIAWVNTLYLVTWGEVFSYDTLHFLIFTFFKDADDASMAVCSWLSFIIVTILVLTFKLGRIVWLKRIGR